MLSDLTIPQPTLPLIPPEYPQPKTADVLLPWDFVVQQMSAAEYYWLATSGADGVTHTMPVWGYWFRDRIHFDGSPDTRWARNLLQNPQIAVHLPSAEQVVIIEGRAAMLDEADLGADVWAALDAAFQQKYHVKQGSPFWVVHPRKVLAWDTPGLERMTRWVFG
ncbi:MAG: pyridoxamine 5'-phosphate oxidase family protein [Anaerolineae bacterium]|nr:pyridoxamine 5'-phosphate oxidase family protein [Anaerolineae bacterium]